MMAGGERNDLNESPQDMISFLESEDPIKQAMARHIVNLNEKIESVQVGIRECLIMGGRNPYDSDRVTLSGIDYVVSILDKLESLNRLLSE